MSTSPILLMGGSGTIGRRTAETLRAHYPEVPLLIGGRDMAKAQSVADRLGHATAVAIDAERDDLGLGDRPIAAVAVFHADERLAALRYAHARGIGHLGISSGIHEIAPEVAIHMQRPDAAAVVLGYEWLVGATTIATLACSGSLVRIDAIRIGALVDDDDQGGPAVAEDFSRIAAAIPSVLARVDGAFVWRKAEDAGFPFRAIDGTAVEASGFSSIDIAGLAAVTGARDVAFGIAIGTSSTRRAGGAKSTEIVIELTGVDAAGSIVRRRHAVFHPGGTAQLTALGTSMVIERLAGLDGRHATPAGLFFPYLGRRSCRLSRPVRAGGWQAHDAPSDRMIRQQEYRQCTSSSSWHTPSPHR